MRRAALLTSGLALAVSGCGFVGSHRNPEFDPDQNKPVLLPSASGSALDRGRPGPTCLNGWVEPARTDPRYDAARAAVSPGARARQVRYFTGRLDGAATDLWYVEVSSPAARAGRWLVTRTGSAEPRARRLTEVPLPSYLSGCLPASARN